MIHWTAVPYINDKLSCFFLSRNNSIFGTVFVFIISHVVLFSTCNSFIVCRQQRYQVVSSFAINNGQQIPSSLFLRSYMKTNNNNNNNNYNDKKYKVSWIVSHMKLNEESQYDDTLSYLIDSTGSCANQTTTTFSDIDQYSTYSVADNIVHDDTLLNDKKTKTDISNSNSIDLDVTQSILLLNIVAIIWGSQHAVIKIVIDDTNDPSSFTLLRFTLAAIISSPYTPGLSKLLHNIKSQLFESTTTLISNTQLSINGSGNNINILKTNDNRNTKEILNNSAVDLSSSKQLYDTWRFGIELGIYMFLGFSFQAIGLEYTTAQRSGFLLYLNVKFVPFFARILFGRIISISTWISAIIAFIGTALLAGIIQLNHIPFLSQIITTDVVQVATTTNAWNVGDVWSIAAAMTSALFILRLERASIVVPNSAELNSACLWIVALFSAIWSFTIHDSGTDIIWNESFQNLYDVAIHHPIEIVYLGAITTALANYIQTKAQSNISAERASIIYAMDPVYGALFSYWILNETLNGIEGYIGAGLITIAAATNAFLDFSNTNCNNNNSDKVESS